MKTRSRYYGTGMAEFIRSRALQRRLSIVNVGPKTGTAMAVAAVPMATALPYELLTSDARNLLRGMRITEEEYRSSFLPNCQGSHQSEAIEGENESENNKENLPPGL